VYEYKDGALASEKSFYEQFYCSSGEKQFVDKVLDENVVAATAYRQGVLETGRTTEASPRSVG
jgi:hypothetical protein